jgi:hypothetical protein
MKLLNSFANLLQQLPFLTNWLDSLYSNLFLNFSTNLQSLNLLANSYVI